MMTIKMGRRALIASVVATLSLVGSLATPVLAEGHKTLESIHFLIPGGAGGGWDGTARGTGEALTKAGLVATASYETCPAAAAARPSAI